MESAAMIRGVELRIEIAGPRAVPRSRVLGFKQELGCSCRNAKGEFSQAQRVVEARPIERNAFFSSASLPPFLTSNSKDSRGKNGRSQARKKLGDWIRGDEVGDFPAEKDPLQLKEGALFRGFPEDGSALSPSPSQAMAKSVLLSSENSDTHSQTEEKLLRALKERRTEDAWQLHEVLRRGGTLASQVCLSRLVAQLSLKGTPSSLARSQRVLVELQKADQVGLLDGDSLGLLVMASARTGAARYALSILRLMLQMDICPPVKVWSAVVSRLGKHPYDAPLALDLFDDICGFLGLELTAQDATFGGNGSRNSITLHKQPLRPDTGAFNAVLNACATLALVQRAEKLLDRMAACGVEPDLLTFNILIKLFAKAEEGDQLPNILQEMEVAGIEPDLATYNSLVASYVSLGELDEAERLVQSMQQGSFQEEPNNRAPNANPTELQKEKAPQVWKRGIEIASEMAQEPESGKALQRLERGLEDASERAQQPEKSQDLRDVERGTETASERVQAPPSSKGESPEPKHQWKCKIKPDVRTYTTLMKGYVKNDRLRDAVQLLVAMQSQNDSKSRPNDVTYTTIITAFVNMGLMDEAKSVLVEMVTQKVPANLVTYNVLLKGYCSAGQVATAYEVIRDMRKAELSPDVVSYNTLINGCIQRDDNVGALEVFREMRRARIGPTEISYTTLMNAFARNGEPQLAAEVFQEMRTHAWMRVDVIAWNVLIDGYCRAGQMDSAKQSFAGMKEEGFHPSVATYGCLVKGFASAGDAGEVLVLWKEIQERTMAKRGDQVEPLEPDGGLLDVLVDTCLRAGFFQKAMEVVSCMEGQGILADKTKYKRMFIELYSTLYTSKHASARRRAKSAEKRSAVDAFKFWLGFPNQYYQSDWKS